VRTLESMNGRVSAIVIGTSAGGIDALSAVLPALSRRSVPVFIVLHLPRERPSLLVALFQHKCSARVCEAQDKDPIERGTIYFAPPDYHLLVDEGPHLALSTDELVHFSRPSIDVLFETAADVYGERLLGIVLTGASEDGAAGLAAVHRAGGWTVAQDPATADVSIMAEAAIKRTPVDFVLTLEQIANVLRTMADGELQ
jgi:two-component system chemotaxis response regulator CheB